MGTLSNTPVAWDRYLPRHINSLLALIGVACLSLSVFRTWPVAIYWSIALAVFAAPTVLLARMKIAETRDRGELVPVEDRLALFLSLSLFTVPTQLYVFSQFVFYRDGWELGPIGWLIYRWWLTISS